LYAKTVILESASPISRVKFIGVGDRPVGGGRSWSSEFRGVDMAWGGLVGGLGEEGKNCFVKLFAQPLPKR